MFSFLALIFGRRYWRLHSVLIRWILKLYGIQVGHSFYIEGVPKLKIRGKSNNIIIEDNVSVLGDIDLRNRENGKIIFRKNVTIENCCRFVAARDGVLEIGEGSIVTAFVIMNGGADLIIGKQCIIGPRSSINANDHCFSSSKPIREQGFVHHPVIIEDDCWLAANVAICKGVRLKKGSVVGANAVVTSDTEPYSINVGVPSKKIAERSK